MANIYTCIIVDDEQHAIGLLAETIKGLYNNLKIIGLCSTFKDAIETLRVVKPDILFLDISIAGKNGMEILKIVPGLECEIIFVTAYSEFAVDAFKVSASGYIVKPAGDTELSNAVDKAIERIKNKKLARQYSNSVAPFNSKIGIPNGKGISYFDIDDIIYFEANTSPVVF